MTSVFKGLSLRERIQNYKFRIRYESQVKQIENSCKHDVTSLHKLKDRDCQWAKTSVLSQLCPNCVLSVRNPL